LWQENRREEGQEVHNKEGDRVLAQPQMAVLGACYLPFGPADNGFASPPLYRSFKIPLKCGVYIRISTECSKYFIVFNNKY